MPWEKIHRVKKVQNWNWEFFVFKKINDNGPIRFEFNIVLKTYSDAQRYIIFYEQWRNLITNRNDRTKLNKHLIIHIWLTLQFWNLLRHQQISSFNLAEAYTFSCRKRNKISPSIWQTKKAPDLFTVLKVS